MLPRSPCCHEQSSPNGSHDAPCTTPLARRPYQRSHVSRPISHVPYFTSHISRPISHIPIGICCSEQSSPNGSHDGPRAEGEQHLGINNYQLAIGLSRHSKFKIPKFKIPTTQKLTFAPKILESRAGITQLAQILPRPSLPTRAHRRNAHRPRT